MNRHASDAMVGGWVKETRCWSGQLVLDVAGGSVRQSTSDSENTVSVSDRSPDGIL